VEGLAGEPHKSLNIDIVRGTVNKFDFPVVTPPTFPDGTNAIPCSGHFPLCRCIDVSVGVDAFTSGGGER